MKMKKISLIIAILSLSVSIALEDKIASEKSAENTKFEDGDLDTVVVEAAVNSRKSRQVIAWNLKNSWGYVAEGSYCLTSNNVLGKCTSLKNCYPYFKFPDLYSWERWMIGNYDTCTYYNEQGFQTFGICCTQNMVGQGTDTPAIEAVEVSNDLSGMRDNNYPSWPPPIPTHPPDHTPATHPPGFGGPVVAPTTTSKKPITTRTTTRRTTTPSYQGWPPTQAPITTSTTMKPVSEDTGSSNINDATCGTKSVRSGYDDIEDSHPDDGFKVVGGQTARLGDWPWIAVLFNGGKQFCGGSLIDNRHILTAAHCIAHMSSWDVARLTVRLGDYNIHTSTETQHVERRVKRLVRHRGFDMRTLYNDIAILTLDQPVKYSHNIRPICLPSGAGRQYNGLVGTVAGWGSLRENGQQPSTLQQVDLQIWTNGECKQKYGAAAPGGIIESMICAGQAGKDSCSGDSGGPLVVNEGRWTQIGVVSWNNSEQIISIHKKIKLKCLIQRKLLNCLNEVQKVLSAQNQSKVLCILLCVLLLSCL
uniref:Phenoloxidase-activating factor 2 n=1 Tax=Culicoides sonorensis TaxID=179676 RepID=A0A336MH51_CULSO